LFNGSQLRLGLRDCEPRDEERERELSGHNL
jgi:hypothetical protein